MHDYSDFEDLRTKNRYYADKTKYIPLLERAGDFLFLIRPRRFGKSIFLSMLRCYYDIVKHSYILELKYMKAGDSEEEVRKQWDEGVEQVRRYATDRKVEVMARDTELHLLVMQVRVCELVRLEEVY